MRRTLVCAFSLLCSLSWAQTGPSIAPFPLNVRRVPTGFTSKNEEALSAEVRKALRDTGASVPNAFKIDQALAELKRQDCDLENECLSTFALKSGMLYGLYVSIDLNVQNVVVVSGRVVRSDGALVVEQRSLNRPLGKDSFAAVAKDLVTKLFRDELKLSVLPVAKPVSVKPPEVTPVVDAGVAVVAPIPVDAGVLLPPASAGRRPVEDHRVRERRGGWRCRSDRRDSLRRRLRLRARDSVRRDCSEGQRDA